MQNTCQIWKSKTWKVVYTLQFSLFLWVRIIRHILPCDLCIATGPPSASLSVHISCASRHHHTHLSELPCEFLLLSSWGLHVRYFRHAHCFASQVSLSCLVLLFYPKWHDYCIATSLSLLLRDSVRLVSSFGLTIISRSLISLLLSSSFHSHGFTLFTFQHLQILAHSRYDAHVSMILCVTFIPEWVLMPIYPGTLLAKDVYFSPYDSLWSKDTFSYF